MPRIVRGALLQATWTGDKESMIQKHEGYAHDAAKAGAQVMLFQELFYGPYFCQVQEPQYFSYTELIPDGPTTQRMQALAKETGMVLVVPMYEEDSKAAGVYYNTAAVIDADGTYLGKYRKTHIPHVKGFWEKYFFRPGNLGYPVFQTRGGQGRRVHLLRPPLPRGRPRPGPQRRRDRAHPVGHRRGLSQYLWRLEQLGHAVANGYFVGAINRVGTEARGRRRLLRPELLRRSAWPVRRRRGRRHKDELLVATSTSTDRGSPPDLAVLPGPPAGDVRRPRQALTPQTRLTHRGRGSAPGERRRPDRAPSRA